jgi:hypothetical protein
MRITDQFRHQGSMMYDFKGPHVRLTIRIRECSGGWEVEAIPKQPLAVESLTATALSRREALQAIAEAWLDAPNLPPVDWTEIGVALSTVRAI